MNVVFIVFFYRNTKKNFYTFRPMESNYLKCSAVYTVHSIELKFDSYIIGHRWKNHIDFYQCKALCFLEDYRK